jgi:hypothetical protein
MDYWEQEIEDYKPRRHERLRKHKSTERKSQENKYAFLQGERLPRRLRQEIYKFAGSDCNDITEGGTRCSRAFEYKNEKGQIRSCTNFCIENCDRWIDDVIDNLPRFIIINDIRCKISTFRFLFENDIYRWSSPIQEFYHTQWYHIDSDGNDYKVRNIKSELCYKIRETGTLKLELEIIRPDEHLDLTHLNKGNKIENLVLVNQHDERWFTPGWKFDHSSRFAFYIYKDYHMK